MSVVEQQDNDLFRKRLAASHEVVELVARQLKHFDNYRVTIPQQQNDCPDYGDLLVYRANAPGQLFKVEVRERCRENFHGPEDFPYPDAIVCDQHRWDDVDTKPDLLVYVASNRQHFFQITAESAQFWELREQFTGQYQGRMRHRMAYFCPREHLQFGKFYWV